jgi:hypothetical protein
MTKIPLMLKMWRDNLAAASAAEMSAWLVVAAWRRLKGVASGESMAAGAQRK